MRNGIRLRARPVGNADNDRSCAAGDLRSGGSPAYAQPELAGSWAPRGNEFTTGTGLPVDFTGMPLNEEGRLRALSYNESQLGMIERQCQGWPASYLVQGPFGLRIWSDLDPVKGTVRSWTIGAWEDKPAMTIWMDGRSHPGEYRPAHARRLHHRQMEREHVGGAYHAPEGGLATTVGAPVSDRATMTTRFARHGDILAVLVIIEDPDYLAEPWLLSKTFRSARSPCPQSGRRASPRSRVSTPAQRSPLPAGEEPLHRRADDKVRRPQGRRAGIPETSVRIQKSFPPPGR